MITDTNDINKSSANVALRPGATAEATLRVDCQTGKFLQNTGDPVDNVVIFCRKVGDVAWINIETTPINLTPYDGTKQDFEFQFTDNRTDTLRSREQFVVGVR